MQQAYNAYIAKVLEEMTASSVSLADAKRVCRGNLQFLEQSYVNLSNTKSVADQLMAA